MPLTLSNTLKNLVRGNTEMSTNGLGARNYPPPPPGTKVEEKENWRLEILATALRNERQFQS